MRWKGEGHGGRGYHEWFPRRPFAPDLATIAVLLLLLFVPTIQLVLEQPAWTLVWLALAACVGLVLVAVDEHLLPVATRVRWNAWGLVILDRAGRVTRSLAWSSITSFRLDRCVNATMDRELVLVLCAGEREFVWGLMPRVGDLRVDPWAIETLTAFLRQRGVPETPGGGRRQRPWSSGWSLRSLLGGLLWATSAVTLVVVFDPTLAAPGSLLLALPSTIWITHRVEPFLRALRQSAAGVGMRTAKVSRVRPEALVLEVEGAERIVRADVADPRDGTSPESVALARLTWSPASRVFVSTETKGGPYRGTSEQRVEHFVSTHERDRGRRAVTLALLALALVAPSAVSVPWARAFSSIVWAASR